MLNIENKYKAFHISFYPHTSLTAGLNIFEKTFHSRRKRMHIHIYTCKWTCLPAINQKPKLQYHQSPSTRRKKIKNKKCTYSKSISQLVHSPFSEQAAFKVGHWSQFYEWNIKHSTIECHLSEHKQEDHLKSFICYRWVTFGVNKKKGHIKYLFFSTEEAMINKRLLHFLSFVYFKRGQL